MRKMPTQCQMQGNNCAKIPILFVFIILFPFAKPIDSSEKNACIYGHLISWYQYSTEPGCTSEYDHSLFRVVYPICYQATTMPNS